MSYSILNLYWTCQCMGTTLLQLDKKTIHLQKLTFACGVCHSTVILRCVSHTVLVPSVKHKEHDISETH